MSLKAQHRAIDAALIRNHRDTFIDMARTGYEQHGRGIVTYRHKNDDACYVPLHVWQKGPDEENAEAMRMLRNYKPESEFIVCIFHQDGTFALYQFAIPKS